MEKHPIFNNSFPSSSLSFRVRTVKYPSTPVLVSPALTEEPATFSPARRTTSGTKTSNLLTFSETSHGAVSGNQQRNHSSDFYAACRRLRSIKQSFRESFLRCGSDPICSFLAPLLRPISGDVS